MTRHNRSAPPDNEPGVTTAGVASTLPSPPRGEGVVVLLRRVSLATLIGSTLGLGALGAWSVVEKNGVTPLEVASFVLFVLLFAPLVVSFWTAMLGVWVRLRQPASVGPVEDSEGALPPTAIVMPVYNEESGRVMAGLRATYDTLEQTGQLSAFDFFVLSDTTDPQAWIDEEVAFERLRSSASDPTRFHYRNRKKNHERKAGNIADFCAAHGDDYRYMVVFDADSVMEGHTLVELVRLMEQNPDAGIIQAPPVPVNRLTLFGRLQQFASAVYGPTFLAGLDAWQRGEANYWGHNAIIRIRPFVEHCSLPTLPGREPLGGSILSHDFVEAALMRRAGWKVRLAPHLGGSYEESPPTLIDYAARDRRWCQGNLQHARLLFMPGLNPISRFNLAMGVMSYAGSALWMMMLALSTVEGFWQRFRGHEYFSSDSLFPVWQISILREVSLLYVGVMIMLFLPKLLSLLLVLRDPRARAQFGGARRLSLSVAFESLFSVLLAPVLAWIQTRFVVTILAGSSVGWGGQQRDDVGTTWGQATKRHGGTTLLGVLWGAAVHFMAPELLPWLSPVLAGFVLSIPLSVLSSRASIGLRAKRAGLLLIPEELEPPLVLRRLRDELREVPEPSGRDALGRVLQDPDVRRIHLAQLQETETPDPMERHRLDGLALKLRTYGPGALDRSEIRDLLSDRQSIETLASGPAMPA